MTGYALFTALPFVGHLNPLLRQAEELRRRGWRVALASTGEMRGHVAAEAPDVPFVDLGALGEQAGELRRLEAVASADPDYRRGGLALVPLLGLVWPTMFDGLMDAIRRDRPDVVVADLFSSAGFCAADAAGVPWLLNNPSLLNAVPPQLMPPAPHVPFVTSGQSIHDVGWLQRTLEPVIRRVVIGGVWLSVGRQLDALRRSRGLPARTTRALLGGRTILVNGAFGLEYVRPLPPHVHMVGPMLPDAVPPLPPELAAWLADGPPVVYVNLGTVAMAPPAQLVRMAAALALDGIRALWVVRGAQAERLQGSLPAHVRLMDWVPSPRALLAHANVRVFVSHCGMNSVYESLSEGTPIVGIPMLADQRDMAARVADAGVGLWMDKTRFTADGLRRAIARVLHEPSFGARIPVLQQAFAAAGGVRRAADLIAAGAAGRPDAAADRH